MKLFWVYYLLSAFALSIVISCANQVPLSGGKEDKEPPFVKWSKPLNKELNYSSNKIILKFNEYVDLNNLNQNLTISPYSNIKPKVHISGKEVIIDMKGIIKDNTTYAIQANNAFQDFKAGNVMKDYNLMFSTGNHLDTSDVQIIAVFPSSIPSDRTKAVLTKTKEDFFSSNYSYISKLKINTAFFNNLDKQFYRPYVFIDSNQNDKWDSNELVGFSDNYIDNPIQKEIISVFYDRSQYQNPSIVAEYNYLYKVTSFGENYDYKLDIPKNVISFNYNNENYLLIDQNRDLSSIQATFMGKQIDIPIKKSTVEKPYISLLKSADFRNSISLDSQDCKIYFSSTLLEYDKDKLQIKMDTSFVDSFDIELKENYLQLNKLHSGKEYSLYLDSAAITNGFLYNKKDTITFSLKPNNDCHDSITIVFEPKISSNQIVLMKEEANFLPVEIKNNRVFVNHICGREITFVIIEDNNKNGFWDTGSIYENIQPEKKYIVKTPLVKNIIEYNITWKREIAP